MKTWKLFGHLPDESGGRSAFDISSKQDFLKLRFFGPGYIEIIGGNRVPFSRNNSTSRCPLD